MTLSIALGLVSAASEVPTRQVERVWLDAGEPAPFAGRLLTGDEYRDLITVVELEADSRRTYSELSAEILECRVALAGAQAQRRNRTIELVKSVLILGAGFAVGGCIGGE